MHVTVLGKSISVVPATTGHSFYIAAGIDPAKEAIFNSHDKPIPCENEEVTSLLTDGEVLTVQKGAAKQHWYQHSPKGEVAKVGEPVVEKVKEAVSKFPSSPSIFAEPTKEP